jgi:hypothetical protein
VKKSKWQRPLICLIILGTVLGSGLSAAGATPWSGSASYSIQGKAQFQVGYQVNDLFGFGLGYGEVASGALAGNRWRGQINMTPLETMAFQAGYDLTGNNYFLGGQAEFPLNQNLAVASELDVVIPARDGAKYLDYRLGLQIGIGYQHYLFAGGQGLYQVGTPHEPELFVELDLNWQLAQNWGIRLQPHVGVEGEFSHRTTVTKEWANNLETGLFVGKNTEGRWDVGLFARY